MKFALSALVLLVIASSAIAQKPVPAKDGVVHLGPANSKIGFVLFSPTDGAVALAAVQGEAASFGAAAGFCPKNFSNIAGKGSAGRGLA